MLVIGIAFSRRQKLLDIFFAIAGILSRYINQCDYSALVDIFIICVSGYRRTFNSLHISLDDLIHIIHIYLL